jgi:putative GTP pyrophosphokinase
MRKPRNLGAVLGKYHAQKATYERLAKTAESILQNLLQKERIPVVSVSSRVKTSESLIEKQRRKRYKNPAAEITDIIGLRVITYTEDDATRVCQLVNSTFSVDSIHTVDRATQLEVDQIGYRSHHFVCELGDKRVGLPEFQAFKDIRFEVQVRTVLQHAWAEVEHDRNYKFAGALTTSLQRRLFLISGLLEMGDRELNQLSRDIDAYATRVEKRAREGELKGEELTSTSLRAFLPELAKELRKTKMFFNADQDTLANVVDECRSLGFKTTTDLKPLFTPEFLGAVDKFERNNNEAGLTRDAMIYNDIDAYFKTAWKDRWVGTDIESVALWSSKWGADKVHLLLQQHKIEIGDADFFEQFSQD